ncbi:MAG: HU family DNA-binding protein [Candidatus Methylumidiphilus sp.]
MRTKQELIDALSERTGQTKKEASAFVDALGELAQEAMMAEQEIILPGIGKLTVKSKAARMGRNPQTGASIEIAARKTPAFAAAKILKDAAANL